MKQPNLFRFGKKSFSTFSEVVEFAKNCSVEDQHEIADRLLDMYNKLDNAQENHAEYLFQIIETEEFRSSLPKDYWNQKFKHVEK